MKKKKLISLLLVASMAFSLQLVVHQAETTKTLTKVETKKH